MRVVLDTNVLIAAALRGGFAEDIIDLAATKHAIALITSEEILAELRQKLISKFDKPEFITDFFVGKIRNISEVVQVTENLTVITRDPDDNKILECAIAGHADLIISSDQDLIKLKQFRTIGIVHPKTFGWTFPKYFKKSKL